MKDVDYTKKQLQDQLRQMRQRILELEPLENKLKELEIALQQDRALIATVLDATDTLVRNFVGAVLDIANALIVVFDPEGRVLNVNPTFEQTTNYSLAEVQGKHVWQLLSVPEHKERVQATFQEMRTGQTGKPIECSWVMKNGKRRHISWSHITLLHPDGSIQYILGTGVDITEQKIAEEEIRKALQKEKELNELKSRFVSIASHEYRTPLTTIIMSSELLEKFSDRMDEDRRREELKRIKNCAKRMSELIDDVLVISKAESGSQDFNPTNFDLEDFCRELVTEIQRNTKGNHTIVFRSQNLPKQACMDEMLLQHILTNLLSNAIKYSPQGDRVDFELTCQDGEAIFKIKDSGIGIPVEDQPRLFESFHRAKNVGKIPGTGLGLSIVKTMIESHGGSIKVESEIGVGTSFIVILPLNRVMEINDEPNDD